ncbi:MAG: hypothetical protein JXK95_09185 [Bacteroidales bacterium]|nr:hypothetical protein [Bacteroidales bacterium]
MRLILGQLIKDGQQAGEIAKQEQPLKVNVPDGYIKPKTLPELGITRKESRPGRLQHKRMDIISMVYPKGTPSKPSRKGVPSNPGLRL